MHCPKCGCDVSKVVDSRASEGNDAIRRRRECVECSFRFTTYERREEMPILVIKRDGSREPFSHEKLRRGLMAATIKRDVDLTEINALIDQIEAELRDSSKYEVSSQEIGMMVLQKLINIDKVAYVRFASVYRDFQDIDEFNRELRSLSQ
ncbi:transcriptional regulator NrdR [Fannyhessea vaginae PB189-T1-4]|uniref:Transcriptional repressor NrdR n=1 Tax=Fannyhessea vaginae PB189-T1-4 TaxID=866774 RepID=A0ABP2IXD3_9ACTN|nr:transcriptional regulator NrdR [Fannyhessea vaginae]EFL43761.1 transcriptional regulator NrdR [Fannyhessea vaginae PB189-T1-4]